MSVTYVCILAKSRQTLEATLQIKSDYLFLACMLNLNHATLVDGHVVLSSSVYAGTTWYDNVMP